MPEIVGHEPDSCSLDVVIVTDALLRAFARGELHGQEAEAMQAFLDDHPELDQEDAVARRPPSPL